MTFKNFSIINRELNLPATSLSISLAERLNFPAEFELTGTEFGMVLLLSRNIAMRAALGSENSTKQYPAGCLGNTVTLTSCNDHCGMHSHQQIIMVNELAFKRLIKSMF